MTKVLVVLFILLVVLALIATRYRRQIMMGIQVWKAFKKMREGARPPEKAVTGRNDANVPLVKCVKCGTWVPKTSALNLGPNTYCSTTCVERSEVRV